MSGCPELDQLQALIAGLLSEERREGLLEHLGSCIGCASELEALVGDDSPAVGDEGEGVPGHAIDLLPATRRFEIRRCLGLGGFGIVFEAFDRERGALVALKWLRNVTPAVLARFKREFRALAEIDHPNLLVPRELLAVEGRWLLTMDLVEGVTFLDWVRHHPEPATTESAEGLSPHGADLDRLREASRQLAAGLTALHRAGIVHRDIKPHNVLVTAAGRVVLLDFGLAAELGEGGLAQTSIEQLVGTPAYAAPEQCAGERIGEAADWYAVGVMLFQALCGRLPLSGSTAEVLLDKRRLDAPGVETLVSGVPPELARLCADLLARDPARRPVGSEVMRRLEGAVPERLFVAARARRTMSATSVFVGRRRERQALRDAFAVADRGGLSVALVHGEPGIGKSALCRSFLAELEAERRDVLVLRARCNEREAIPYRALDGLVDGLCRYLMRLPEAERASALPRDLDVLARVFPVLQQVASGHRSFRAERRGSDLEMRLWAFDALRDLVARLSTQRPIVLYIDDLQWGDADSRPFFEGLLRPPTPPGLLLVASYRAADAAGAPLVEVLLGARGSRRAGAHVSVVDVASLEEAEARELALALAADRGAAAVEAIAKHAGGSPLFLTQLALSSSGDAAPDLTSALRQRLAELPSAERRLVEMVAIAGRPVPVALALDASEAGADADQALVRLCSAQLLRVTSADRVEVYHDRIREVVIAVLDQEVAEHHARWADTLARAGVADPGTLLPHLLGAGFGERAAEQALRGADQALEALAFERAAELFDVAVEHGAFDARTRRGLLRRRADALASAGRVRAAADVYLAALVGAEGREALDSRRRAAEQLLRGGHLTEGLEIARELLRAEGLRLSKTQGRALVSMLWHRAALRLRGLEFRERSEAELNPELLARVDACWAVALGLCNTEVVHGMEFLGKHLRLALDAGEPGRIARGLGLEAMFAGAGGRSATIARARARTTQAMALAERCGDRHARVCAELGTGILAFSEYRWQECRPHFARAKELDAAGGAHATWERGTADWFTLASLLFAGEVGEMHRAAATLVSQARERGDRYTATLLRAWIVPMGYLWCADDPQAAREELADAMSAWTRDAFHLMHLLALYTEASIHLYERDVAGAHRVITEGWPRLVASHLFQVRALEIHSRELRGRATLALARCEPERNKALLRAVEADVRWLAKQERTLPKAYATVLGAGLAAARGADPRPWLQSATDSFTEAGMDLWAAAARRRYGELEGGSPGQIAIDAADEALVRLGVRAAERTVALMLPWPRDQRRR